MPWSTPLSGRGQPPTPARRLTKYACRVTFFVSFLESGSKAARLNLGKAFSRGDAEYASDGLSAAMPIVKFRQQLMGIAALNPSYLAFGLNPG